MSHRAAATISTATLVDEHIISLDDRINTVHHQSRRNDHCLEHKVAQRGDGGDSNKSKLTCGDGRATQAQSGTKAVNSNTTQSVDRKSHARWSWQPLQIV